VKEREILSAGGRHEHGDRHDAGEDVPEPPHAALFEAAVKSPTR
jgi:hypothetical protein